MRVVERTYGHAPAGALVASLHGAVGGVRGAGGSGAALDAGRRFVQLLAGTWWRSCSSLCRKCASTSWRSVPTSASATATLLEAAVERPRQSAFGDDAYPTHASKAGALLESPARNHPFVDGNKQVAVLASFEFLHTVETSNDDVVSTVLDLITRNIDFAELGVRVERWITSSAAG